MSKARQPKSKIKIAKESKTNAGRSQYAYHPFWVWQLLRRNKTYVDAVNTFVSKIKHNTELSKALLTGQNISTALANHSDLYEYFLEINSSTVIEFNKTNIDEFGARIDVLNENLDRKNENWLKSLWAEAYSDKFEKNYLNQFPKPNEFNAQSVFNFHHKLNIKDFEAEALAKFQFEFDGIISFPISPENEFPSPELLTSLLWTYPIKETNSMNPISIQRSEESSIKTFEINLNFSKERIQAAVMDVLKSNKKNERIKPGLFDGLNERWDILAQKIYSFDQMLAGKAPDKIALEVFGVSSSNHIKQIKRYSDSVKSMIYQFNSKVHRTQR